MRLLHLGALQVLFGLLYLHLLLNLLQPLEPPLQLLFQLLSLLLFLLVLRLREGQFILVLLYLLGMLLQQFQGHLLGCICLSEVLLEPLRELFEVILSLSQAFQLLQSLSEVGRDLGF